MKCKTYESTNGESSPDGSFEWLYYPNEFISATEELPCSIITIYEDPYGNTFDLPERIFKATFHKSPRNGDLLVPVIDSARCGPHLSCFLWFEEFESLKTPVCRGPITPDFQLAEYTDKPCIYKEADYSAYQKANDCSVRYWKPKCKYESGVFAPVQLKSND